MIAEYYIVEANSGGCVITTFSLLIFRIDMLPRTPSILLQFVLNCSPSLPLLLLLLVSSLLLLLSTHCHAYSGMGPADALTARMQQTEHMDRLLEAAGDIAFVEHPVCTRCADDITKKLGTSSTQ